MTSHGSSPRSQPSNILLEARTREVETSPQPINTDETALPSRAWVSRSISRHESYFLLFALFIFSSSDEEILGLGL